MYSTLAISIQWLACFVWSGLRETKTKTKTRLNCYCFCSIHLSSQASGFVFLAGNGFTCASLSSLGVHLVRVRHAGDDGRRARVIVIPEAVPVRTLKLAMALPHLACPRCPIASDVPIGPIGRIGRIAMARVRHEGGGGRSVRVSIIPEAVVASCARGRTRISRNG